MTITSEVDEPGLQKLVHELYARIRPEPNTPPGRDRVAFSRATDAERAF